MDEKILEKLNNIEKYSLLAAKSVLTFDDVIALTGLSKSFLYKCTMRSEIPHYKPNGKKIYFDRKEVEDWMKQNRIATKQEIDLQANAYIVTGKMKGGAK